MSYSQIISIKQAIKPHSRRNRMLSIKNNNVCH
nr:MAG TPA: hypothetical protein [Caudoviricetes sp.]DAT52941.1 MAG TPA: hypothetical protein [Caudoviricetes sp.]